MELLQLRYFYESAKSESFAKTAEKFMVPPSSVSASVKRLEKELGTELFSRSSNRIMLNDKGYLLAKALGDIFEKLDYTVAEIQENNTQNTEISILIKARRKWITDLIIEYKKTHPCVNFRISNDFYIREFSDFDIIIDEQSDTYGNLERFLLSVENICIKASKNHPLCGQKLRFEQLSEQPFIMTRKNSGIRKILENTAKSVGFLPNITIECNDSNCLLKYVKAGMGLTLGSYNALLDDGEKDIIPLDVIDFKEVQSVYVYHRKFTFKDIAAKNFCDFLSVKGTK